MRPWPMVAIEFNPSVRQALEGSAMEQFLDMLVQRPVATVIGAIGMLCVAAYPLCRTRPLLLTIYLANNIAFAAHYALLDQPTAATMNLLLGAQTLLAIGLARWPRLRWVYHALMLVMLGAAGLTWRGLPSLLCATATGLSSFGRMQRNEAALRLLLLGSAHFWVAHALLVGSLPGLIASLSSIATGAWMISRHWHLNLAGRPGRRRPTPVLAH